LFSLRLDIPETIDYVSSEFGLADIRNLTLKKGDFTEDEFVNEFEDFVRGRSPYAEMFAVNMLASTQSGGTWTEEQYRKWLKDAGFSNIEVLDLADKEKQLITATRYSRAFPPLRDSI
jgi:hypothetical protein